MIKFNSDDFSLHFLSWKLEGTTTVGYGGAWISETGGDGRLRGDNRKEFSVV